MARSKTTPLVSLDRYAAVMGLSPAHFNHLDDGNPGAMVRAFWTQDHHDQLAEALQGAETMLRDALGFAVAPQWRGAWIPFRPSMKVRQQALSGLAGASYGGGDWSDLLPALAWQRATVTAPDGYIQQFGAERRTLVEAGVSVTYEEDETVTISVADVGTTAPAEVQVFYTVTDGADEAGAAAWRIPSLAVVIDNGDATITGPKWALVTPEVLAADEAGDYSSADNFVTTVDVYRVDVNPETPVTVVWDGAAVGEDDPSANYSETGVGYLTDSKYGEFNVRTASYSGGVHTLTTPAYTALPRGFDVSYQAGYPLGDNGYTHPSLEMAVIRLANTLLPETFHWLRDLAKTWRDDRQAVPGEMVAKLGLCPFGLTQGAYQAWAIAQQFKNARPRF